MLDIVINRRTKPTTYDPLKAETDENTIAVSCGDIMLLLLL